MTTYLGVDVLLIRPNSLTAWSSDVNRPVRRAETDTANVLTATTDAPATTTYTLEWICETRADLTALRAVLDARLGQVVPFWVPTYLRDIELLGVGFFSWTVPTDEGGAAIGAQINAATPWRHWFQSSPGGALYVIRRMSSASDNGDGTWNWVGTNQFGTGSPFLTSADAQVFSRLMYCRLATDSYRVVYHGKSSVVTADIVEVTAETP